MTDDNKSLGDDATLGGENAEREIDAQSLGDQSTHGDHSQMDSVGDSSSLGDQLTFGGDGADGAPDDGMEIVDLESRYTIERVLGKGGMGEVLLATDTRLERKVAIKRIHGKQAGSKTAVNRFLAEAKAVAALNHPNIVQIYDYGRDKDGPFLIMEYVEGESLLDLGKQGPIPIEKSIQLMCQVCDGLEQAHRSQIIHRDIKPSNILVSTDGIAKLTDFGLAKNETTDAQLTAEHTTLGTLDFMPPEQRQDISLVEPRSDLWAAGATLYQLLTGKSPRLIQLDNVPPVLRRVLGKVLDEEPANRYADAKHFRAALNKCLKRKTPCPACYKRLTIDLQYIGKKIKCPKCETVSRVQDDLTVTIESGSTDKPIDDSKMDTLVTTEKPAQSGSRKRINAKVLITTIMIPLGGIAGVSVATLLLWVGFGMDPFGLFRADTEPVAQTGTEVPSPSANRPNSSLTNTPPPTNDPSDPAMGKNSATTTAKPNRTAPDTAEANNNTTSKPPRSAAAPAWLNEDLMGYYPLDGNARADGEGQVDGNLGNVEWTSDRFDRKKKAAHFLGDLSSYIELRPLNLRRHNLTVSCWVKVDEFETRSNQVPSIWGIPRQSNGSGSGLSLDYPNWTVTAGSHPVKDTKTKELIHLTGSKAIMDQGWFHYTLCLGEKTTKLFENGILVGISSHDSTASLPVQGTVQLGRGLLTTVTSSHLVFAAPSDIDDFRIYGRVLTDDEVKELYEYESQPPEPLAKETPPTSNPNPSLTGTAPATAIAPFDATQAKAHQQAWADYLGVPVEFENSIGMKFRLIPPGEFTMGDGWGETNEQPVRRVTLTRPFYLSTYEVTQDQYFVVTNANPAKQKEKNLPADGIWWSEADAFCKKLRDASSTEGSDLTYRLPTEAEWEYGCRSGTETKYYYGDDPAAGSDYGWFNENSDRQLHPVGQKKPNAWGLYDMLGNNLEYCSDYNAGYPNGDAITDPTGPANPARHLDRAKTVPFYIRRGGGRDELMKSCSSAGRGPGWGGPGHNYMTVGIRLLLEIPDNIGTLQTSLDASRNNRVVKDAAQTANADTPKVSGPPQSNTPPPPALAAFDESQAKAHQQAWANYWGVPTTFKNRIGMKFQLIPPGTFTMGAAPDSEPLHTVSISRPFYMGIHEVTQANYREITGENPSAFQGDKKPVERVSWNDANSFCTKLNERMATSQPGLRYRLPTEAEWEYACRAGTTGLYSFDNGNLGEYAWCQGTGASQNVGQRLPNPWGLHDMHGNVFEWCQDWRGDYPTNSTTDPPGPAEGSSKVFRGGSWYTSSWASRCDIRHSQLPTWNSSTDMGFRVIVEVERNFGSNRENADVQYNLGLMYASGKTITKDPAQALEWSKKAAEQRHHYAYTLLAYLYAQGDGIPKDTAEAIKWYTKAADLNDPRAQCLLGRMYAYGEGVPQDWNQAIEWFTRAAEQGDTSASVELGIMYREGKVVTKDLTKAINFYTKAAEAGNAYGQFNLGSCYYEGDGVAKDRGVAAKLWEKAAKQEHTKSQLWLAICYFNGDGMTKDPAKAVYWLHTAADKGDADSQYRLGLSYYKGIGVSKDSTEAVRWWEKAADQGHSTGQVWFGLMYERGTGINQDISKAFKLYTQSAEQNDKYGQYNLGSCYYNGKGVTKDEAEGISLWRKAAEQGEPRAIEALKQFDQKTP